MYDAVRRIERYLDRNFSYSEKPRAARYPLNAFLFRDKFGYCQQFSGAMALMLRMVGIPAASRPASRPARSTATRASTACATSTPTPGSRCTSTASAG